MKTSDALLALSALIWSLGAARPAPLRAEAAPSASAQAWHVASLRIEGLSRTDEAWLRDYLDVSFPTNMTQAQAEALAARVRSTGVFTEATVAIVPAPNATGETYLSLTVTEKWTLIPVLRGAYGGGTPLTVFGLYDTHAFGRLITVGAQTLKYGDAPRGGVAWVRAPRFMRGRYALGLEVEKDNRIRSVFDRKDEAQGQFDVFSKGVRAFLLGPVSTDRSSLLSRIQLGGDFRYQEREASHYTVSTHYAGRQPQAFADQTELGPKSRAVYALARAIYDDTVFMDSLNADGHRLVLDAGPVYSPHARTQTYADADYFYNLFLPPDLSFVAHAFAGYNSFTNLTSHFYLGGFESVRGLPDGVMHGSRAFYANGELRRVVRRERYLWVQALAFVDAGSAGPDFAKAMDHVRSSAGVGVRFAVPQVYRLLARIDYAWSLDKGGVHGIALGMNQFIDPYKPL